MLPRSFFLMATGALCALTSCFDDGAGATGSASGSGSGSAGTDGSTAGTSGGTTAGTTAGTSATGSGSGANCGPTDCSDPCGGPANCDSGEYCDAGTLTCLPKKDAGVGCGGSAECDAGLTCLDGVCCTSSACDPCLNCGGTGMCSIMVTSAKDVSGSTCDGDSICDPTGVCILDLGQECTADPDCASGHCVDGVCCDTGSCGECLDCGMDGTCSVPVLDMDDASGTCNGSGTCDGAGACVPRWELVGVINESQPPWASYSATLGNTLYFAGGNGSPEYFATFDTVSNTQGVAVQTNWDYCWCGYSGVTVSDGVSLFYFGNPSGNDGDGQKLTPGDAQWQHLASYDGANVADGENATARLGGSIYRIGGRDYPTRTSSYNIAGNTWNLGLAAAPANGDQRCAGAAGSSIYMFGDAGGPAYVYSTGGNSWATLPSDPNQPDCYMQELHLWQGRLVYADGAGVAKFRTATQSWETSRIPLPEADLQWPRAMVSNDTLFLVALNNANGNVQIWKHLLAP